MPTPEQLNEIAALLYGKGTIYNEIGYSSKERVLELAIAANSANALIALADFVAEWQKGFIND